MKRKDRKTEVSEQDIMEPLGDLLIIGSENDPCFGKYHDPLNSTCKKCGDSEMCAIAKATRLHKKRLAQGIFKDDEEANFDLERMAKFIEKAVKGMEKVSLSRLQKMTIDHFKTFEEVNDDQVKKMVLDWVKRSPKYKKWSDKGIKYLKLK